MAAFPVASGVSHSLWLLVHTAEVSPVQAIAFKPTAAGLPVSSCQVSCAAHHQGDAVRE